MSPQRTLLARRSRRSHLDEQFNRMSEKLRNIDKDNKNLTEKNKQGGIDILAGSLYTIKLS